MKKFDLKKSLADLARQWPSGGELVFFVESDHVWLHKIRLPQSARGTGTEKMAAFLALTDKAGLPVCLTADPVLDDEMPSGAEPSTFDLVRWYKRFDFVPLGPSEDGFLMQREPMGLSKESIIQKYQANKLRHDLTIEQFNTQWVERPYRSLGM